MMISLILILIALVIRVGFDLYLCIRRYEIANMTKDDIWFWVIFSFVLFEEILPLLAFIVVAYF